MSDEELIQVANEVRKGVVIGTHAAKCRLSRYDCRVHYAPLTHKEASSMSDEELIQVANEVRKGVVIGTHAAKSGHPGGSLGAADIITYLYFEEMNVDSADPRRADRDRFVLSKGHCAPALYAALAERGFFPKEDLESLRHVGCHLQGHPRADRDRFVLSKGHCAPALYAALAERGFFPKEDLESLRHVGCHLQGHPNMNDTPGVDMSTGSLGQGVSAAVGMALAAKHWGDAYRTYCLLGDGEIEEGQVWEAAMFAGNQQLDNLCLIVDHNGLQIDGSIEEVNSAMPIADKFAAFKFHVIELADGNDMAQVRAAFEEAGLQIDGSIEEVNSAMPIADKFAAFKFHVIELADGNDMAQVRAAFEEARSVTGKPVCIVAETVKGKGVSFMEGQVGWHGKAPNDEQFEQAMAELAKEA